MTRLSVFNHLSQLVAQNEPPSKSTVALGAATLALASMAYLKEVSSGSKVHTLCLDVSIACIGLVAVVLSVQKISRKTVFEAVQAQPNPVAFQPTMDDESEISTEPLDFTPINDEALSAEAASRHADLVKIWQCDRELAICFAGFAGISLTNEQRNAEQLPFFGELLSSDKDVQRSAFEHTAQAGLNMVYESPFCALRWRASLTGEDIPPEELASLFESYLQNASLANVEERLARIPGNVLVHLQNPEKDVFGSVLGSFARDCIEGDKDKFESKRAIVELLSARGFCLSQYENRNWALQLRSQHHQLTMLRRFGRDVSLDQTDLQTRINFFVDVVGGSFDYTE